MRTIFLTLALLPVQISVTASQLPNIERFIEYRNLVIERTEDRQLNAKLSSLFGIAKGLRIAEGVAMVLPAAVGVKRRLTMAFSTESEDIFLVESRESASDTVVKVFHTELRSLALLSAASGTSFNDLQLIPNDRSQDVFREVLMDWDRNLPSILKNLP